VVLKDRGFVVPTAEFHLEIRAHLLQNGAMVLMMIATVFAITDFSASEGKARPVPLHVAMARKYAQKTAHGEIAQDHLESVHQEIDRIAVVLYHAVLERRHARVIATGDHAIRQLQLKPATVGMTTAMVISMKR
jgi:hypothetical protein